jgi:hypothetical protein
MADPKCDGRVNFRGMWGQVGIREQAVRPPDDIHVNQTAFGNASGVLVCQPETRARVAGGQNLPGVPYSNCLLAETVAIVTKLNL